MSTLLSRQLSEARSTLVDQRWFLAIATDLLPEVAGLLLHDPDTTVRVATTTNATLPFELQRELIASGDLLTIRALALNTGLVSELQLALASHGDVLVRAALASNPSLSWEARSVLATDWSRLVQRALDSNAPRVPLQRTGE